MVLQSSVHEEGSRQQRSCHEDNKDPCASVMDIKESPNSGSFHSVTSQIPVYSMYQILGSRWDDMGLLEVKGPD